MAGYEKAEVEGQLHSKRRYTRYNFYLFRLCSHSNTLMQQLESLGPKFTNSDRASGMRPVKSVKEG